MNSNIEGICPNCGIGDLDYLIPEVSGTYIHFPFECTNCNRTGTEIHYMVFSSIELDDILDDEEEY